MLNVPLGYMPGTRYVPGTSGPGTGTYMPGTYWYVLSIPYYDQIISYHFFYLLTWHCISSIYSSPPFFSRSLLLLYCCCRNLDPGSHSRLFFPLTNTVGALHFYREKT